MICLLDLDFKLKFERIHNRSRLRWRFSAALPKANAAGVRRKPGSSKERRRFKPSEATRLNFPLLCPVVPPHPYAIKKGTSIEGADGVPEECLACFFLILLGSKMVCRVFGAR